MHLWNGTLSYDDGRFDNFSFTADTDDPDELAEAIAEDCKDRNLLGPIGVGEYSFSDEANKELYIFDLSIVKAIGFKHKEKIDD